MKRKNIIFLSLVAVVILTLVLIAFFVQMHPIEIRYFTDISSFSALEPYVVGNLDAFQDSDIDKETVAASYAKTIEYSGRKYDVYAYVFEDTASAAAYFRDCTGETVSGERQYKSESERRERKRDNREIRGNAQGERRTLYRKSSPREVLR